MNWKVKAFIQNFISLLPESLSEELYYYIQSKFGDLKVISPIERLQAGATIFKLIKKQKMQFDNKVFFELGTGRRLNLPISLWLLNSGDIVTVDLNSYLKKELIQRDLNFMANNVNAVKSIYANTSFDDKKLYELIRLSKSDWQLTDLFQLCNIKYFPKCDARNLELKSSFVDYYISYTVLEHIPTADLIKIIEEAKRIICNEGALIQFIDYRDHFWYSDKKISPINFLKYDESKWSLFANNKYMYMNRLRHDDFEAIFRETSLNILDVLSSVESLSLNEIKLDDRFNNKSKTYIEILDSWFVLKKIM